MSQDRFGNAPGQGIFDAPMPSPEQIRKRERRWKLEQEEVRRDTRRIRVHAALSGALANPAIKTAEEAAIRTIEAVDIADELLTNMGQLKDLITPEPDDD